MKNLFFFLLLVGFTACNDATPALVATADFDPAGYTVEEISGSNAIRVSRYYPDGKLMEEGFIRNGKKDGMWTMYHKEKGYPKTITSYLDGNLDGLFLQFNDRGQIEARTSYRLNQFHGVAASYKFSRPVTENNYNMGQLEGISRTFNELNGKLQTETNYKNGKQDGEYLVYNEDGKIIMRYVYKDGEKVSGGVVEPGSLETK